MDFRKLFTVVVCVLLLGGTAFAAAPTVSWTARHNGTANNADYAKDIALDSAGNVYVTGYAKNTSTNYDFATIKYTPDGNIVWTKTYNRSSSNPDYARAMAVDANSNIIVAGFGYITATGYDGIVVKYDSSGNQLWAKAYNYSGRSDDRFYDVAADANGNIYAIGRTSSNCLTVKYTPDGSTAWVKTYNGAANGQDILYKLAIDSNGNVCACGESTGVGTDQDCLTLKYSPGGALLWARTCNGPADGWDLLEAIALDLADNVYVTGSIETATDSDYVTIKYSPDGNSLWTAFYGGIVSGWDEAYAIALDPNANAVVTGYSQGAANADVATVKYDSATGDQMWAKRYSGAGNSTDFAEAIAADSSGNVYVHGRSFEIGSTDYVTICYNSDGTENWKMNYNGPASQTDIGSAIAVKGNAVYVTGYSMSSANNYDYTTIKYTTTPTNPCPNQPAGDLNADCMVDFSDFLILANNWKESQEPTSGQIVGWGYNGNYGYATSPEGNDFVAIAAGASHSLALKSDGSIIALGSSWGQTPPEGNDFVAIAAGAFHSLTLKTDGSIVGWGNNEYGQCNVPAGNDFVAIAAGAFHSLALKTDGSIVGWGNNDYGQATPPEGNDFVAISAGLWHSLALNTDGSLVAWGKNDEGECNVPDDNNFAAIAAGGGEWVIGGYSLALRSDGSLVAWGYNYNGECNVPAGNDFTAIAAGGGHGLALKTDRSIVGWGYNYYGHGQAIPPAGNDFVAISAGWIHSLALKTDGSIVAWGYDGEGGQATPPAGNDYVAIAAGAFHSLALKTNGSIVGWGSNFYGQATPPAGNDFVAIAAGYDHSLALKTNGSLVAWGSNNYGQCNVPAGNDFVAIAAGENRSLGLKTNGSIVCWGSCWSPPPEGNDFVAIAAGGGHSLALKTDGSIAAWGKNDFGECNVPEPNTGFTAIAAGESHSLGLKTDGSIVAWGSNLNPIGNYCGQCDVPEPNTGFKAIAAGHFHSLGLKTDGSIVGWGDNWYGQATPPAGNDFVAISAGEYYSLALRFNLAGDLNNDYKVDFLDCAIFADTWLECGLIDQNDCWQ